MFIIDQNYTFALKVEYWFSQKRVFLNTEYDLLVILSQFEVQPKEIR